ncbi:hypothetical protein EAF04_007116 [Stromatinia cepivora]|nr:hypothetical protein EAF04_007116 [Stromatinia cepivora]
MYFSRYLSSTLLTSLLASSLTSHLVSAAAIIQRQDTDELGLSLLPICGSFDISNSGVLQGVCDVGQDPVTSSVNLNLCITNSAGDMQFLAHGGFSGSCSGCSVSQTSDSLGLTCKYQTGVPDQTMGANVNLGKYNIYLRLICLGTTRLIADKDGTAVENGSGVFVFDNVNIGCRAPMP